MAQTFLLHKDLNGNVSYGLPSLKNELHSLGYDAQLNAGQEVTITVPPNCYLVFMKFSSSEVRFKVGTTPIPAISVNNFVLNQVELNPFIRLVKPGDTLRFLSEGINTLASISFWGPNNLPSFIPPPVYAGPILYVMNGAGNNISVIDSATNSVITTISNPGISFPIYCLAANKRVYVANLSSNDVSIIDPVTNGLILNVIVGSAPSYIMYEPINEYVIVAHSGANFVSVIDSNKSEVIQNVIGDTNVVQLALRPNSRSDEPLFYSVSRSGNSLRGYSISNGIVSIVTTTTSLSFPQQIVFESNGERGYIVNNGDDSINGVSFPSGGNFFKLTTPNPGPGTLAITPDDKKLYVGNSTTTLDIFDLETFQFNGTGTISISNPSQLLMNKAGTRLYIISSTFPEVSIYDVINNVEITTINLSSNPTYMALADNDTKLYVTDPGVNGVALINTINNTFVLNLGVGTSPVFIENITE